jgi:hypothetical protein
MLRHVVLFAFLQTSSPADIADVCAAFARLPQAIPGIAGFEWGVDVSPEGLQHGFTHSFLLTFVSDAARDAYLVHPAHLAFVAAARPHLSQSLVVDYWAQPDTL